MLKSWAVPKGPCYDPAEKRLAMHTEDHPLEYGEFEGVIPEGQYGGGPSMIWDRGTWEPIEEPHAGYAKGNLKFRLHGEKLEGAWALIRIKGRDARDGDKTWLLIKERDAHVRPLAEYDVTQARPESAVTGRSIEQIAADRDRIWESHSVEPRKSAKWRPKVPEGRKPAAPSPQPSAERARASMAAARAIPGARPGALPKFLAPQLATLVDEAPAGDEWLHELKFDGYRILCRIDGGKVTLLSRNGKDWTEVFPSLARAAARLPCSRALVDGEAAVVLPDGTTSFNALQNAMQEGAQERLAYFAFDLLHLDGQDLTGAALEERKSALADLLRRAGPVADPIRYSDHVAGTGPEFFAQACRMKLEGIICKRRSEPHRGGRGKSWLKVKCSAEQEFVIAGFTDPAGVRGQRGGIGALLLGVHEDGALRFAGKVGTGFTEKMARELRRKLEALEQPRPPFATRAAGVKDAHWVRPELVAEVRFSEWTPDGKLRHPSFQGLREDKKAEEIVREKPAEPPAKGGRQKAAARKQPARKAAAMRKSSSVKRVARSAPSPERPLRSAREREAWDDIRAAKARRGEPRRDRHASSVTVSGVRLTHPDRVLYPGQGITKRSLAEFYEGIADWILPHLEGRPTTLVRCPEGVGEPCFYQKHTGYWAPASLRRVKIQEKTKVGEYLVVEGLAGLVGLVQLGILEIHTWNSRADRLEEPDRIVFDLDPAPDVPWGRVAQAARLVREELRAEGLRSFVKTTGGKGLHVVAPLAPGPGWDECLDYSRRLAERIAAERPREYLAEMSKARRVGRIFIDYLRNLRGSTSIAAYSTRAKPGAPVSAPLHWDELSARTRPDAFTVATLPGRLASLREDPWNGYDRLRQRLPR